PPGCGSGAPGSSQLAQQRQSLPPSPASSRRTPFSSQRTLERAPADDGCGAARLCVERLDQRSCVPDRRRIDDGRLTSAALLEDVPPLQVEAFDRGARSVAQGELAERLAVARDEAERVLEEVTCLQHVVGKLDEDPVAEISD